MVLNRVKRRSNALAGIGRVLHGRFSKLALKGARHISMALIDFA